MTRRTPAALVSDAPLRGAFLRVVESVAQLLASGDLVTLEGDLSCHLVNGLWDKASGGEPMPCDPLWFRADVIDLVMAVRRGQRAARAAAPAGG